VTKPLKTLSKIKSQLLYQLSYRGTGVLRFGGAKRAHTLRQKKSPRQVLSSGFWNPPLMKVLPFDHGRKGFFRLLEFNWLPIRRRRASLTRPKMTQKTTIHVEDFLPARYSLLSPLQKLLKSQRV
jgi:hypothetical protein